MRSTIVLMSLSVLSGCGTGQPPEVPDRPPSPSVPLIWYHSGSDAPEMQLRLDPSGAGRFTGGLAFLNPVRWSFDSVAQELRLEFSHLTAGTRYVFRDGVTRGYALRFDEARSALVLSVTPATDYIWVAGWNFFRDSL